jgi:hypothetical protein
MQTTTKTSSLKVKLSQWYPGAKGSDQTTSGQKGVCFSWLVLAGRDYKSQEKTNLQKTWTINFQCPNNNHTNKRRKEKKREEKELFELFLKYFNYQYKLESDQTVLVQCAKKASKHKTNRKT